MVDLLFDFSEGVILSIKRSKSLNAADFVGNLHINKKNPIGNLVFDKSHSFILNFVISILMPRNETR